MASKTIACPHRECGNSPAEFDRFNHVGLAHHLGHVHRVAPIRAMRLAREAAGLPPEEPKALPFAADLFAAPVPMDPEQVVDARVTNERPIRREHVVAYLGEGAGRGR
jgi:hypothetical protein